MSKLNLSVCRAVRVCAAAWGILHGAVVGWSSGPEGRVEGYEPGTGFAVEFGSGLGYTDPVVLGAAPSRATTGPFGGPVDPFNPPYQREQLLSIGAGGSLTLRFDPPLEDAVNHPYGIDFIVYGGAGFVITNGNFSGGGVTDGSVFGANSGRSRVWVSADGVAFYQLDPAKAPPVDGLLPTDGAGEAGRPANPGLSTGHFAGLGLEGVRRLYDGSAGGVGYDLAWAVDAAGKPAGLTEARVVRIEVVDGHAELDAVTPVAATGWAEDFSSAPAMSGWRVHGDGGRFEWDSVGQRLKVEWDSRETNSYYYKVLSRPLSDRDDFSLSFSLLLGEVVVGVDPLKPGTFQIGAGFFRREDAFRPAFFRGAGVDAAAGPRNVGEWSYFPDSGFGATIAPTLVSSNNQFATSFTFPLEVTIGVAHRVRLEYSARDRVLRTTMESERAGRLTVKEVRLDAGFAGFTFDAVGVFSYSDGGQSPPEFAGSVRARGWIDGWTVTAPEPAARGLTLRRGPTGLTAWAIGESGWRHVLESSADLSDWTEVRGLELLPGFALEAPVAPGGGPGTRFFRIRSERP